MLSLENGQGSEVTGGFVVILKELGFYSFAFPLCLCVSVAK